MILRYAEWLRVNSAGIFAIIEGNFTTFKRPFETY